MKKPAAGAQRRIVLATVVLAAVAIGGATYQQYREIARQRWASVAHDRNAHHLESLRLAVDLRDADVVQLIADLDRARQWPPLHSSVAAAAMIAGGLDDRIAVLPNLLAWIGTTLLAFLVARKAAPAHGDLAGLVAALLVAASPAHRALATDTMLESLGAFLTLLAIYGYLCALRDGGIGAFRLLGASLTLLLVEKYNYWLLVVLGLGTAEIVRNADAVWRLAKAALARVSRRAAWRAWARDPAVYAIAMAALPALWVAIHGHAEWRLFGFRISMRLLGDALYPAYLLTLALVGFRLRRRHAEPLRRLDPRLRQLGWWHGVPLLVFLALPGRLGHLIRHVSPSNTQQPWGGVAHSFASYWAWLASDYHWHRPVFWCVIGFAAIAVAAMLRRRGRDAPVLVVLVVAALLTLLHPNHQSRYLHNWIALIWIAAALGLVATIDASRRAGDRGLLLLVGWSLAIALAIVHAPLAASVGRSEMSGHRGLGVTTRDLTDAYLPKLANARRVGFVSNAPFDKVTEWTFLERYPNRDAFAGFFPKSLAPSHDVEAELRTWLAGDIDRVVAIDVAPASPLQVPRAQRTRFSELMQRQASFRLVWEQTIEPYRATIGVWQRIR